MPPTAGTLTYNSSLGEIPGEDIFRHISIATPYLDLIDEFTLLEQLRFHFRFKKIRSNMHEDEVLNKMGLAHARNKFIANFSSGMRQRLKLSLAFFSQSDIVFLDEPGTNLITIPSWYRRTAFLPKIALFLLPVIRDRISDQCAKTRHNGLQIKVTKSCLSRLTP
jgi:ABC-type Na+ transport system ATPase subunit NatA